jgi:hypothetical protein
MSASEAAVPALDGAAGIPFLPPLGQANQVPATAGSLARLVGEPGAVAMTVETGEVEAILVFIDRQPAVAVARRGSRVTIGGDAFETVAEVPVDRLRLFRVDPTLGRALGAYFLPTVVDRLPVAKVAAEAFIRSFARPDQRACVIVQSAGELGLAFLDGDTVLSCLAPGAGAGGLDRLAGLLAQPDARLTVRVGAADAGAPATDVAAPAADAVAPPGAGAGVAREAAPAAAGPGLAAFLERTGASQAASPVPSEPPPAESPALPRAESADPGLVQAVMAEADQLLGRNSARVAEALRDVEPTPGAVVAALKGLREERVRLVSAETMDLVVERALEVVKERGRAAGLSPG